MRNKNARMTLDNHATGHIYQLFQVQQALSTLPPKSGQQSAHDKARNAAIAAWQVRTKR